MIGGILHNAGYFMGDNLYPPRHSNPKGFFENPELNRINEIILSKYDRPLPSALKRSSKNSTVYCPSYGQRWLMSLPVHVSVTNDDKEIAERIRAALNRRPFSYKDPRFSYTLPVWKRLLDKDIVFICVFREPNVTVNSILKECTSEEYLKNLQINDQKASEVWINVYSHILEKHLNDTDNFVFVHYNQIYNGSALPKLSAVLGVELKHDFVDRKLKRSKCDTSASKKTEKIYNKLCELASYAEERL